MSDPMWERTQLPSGNCLGKPHIAELCSNEPEPTMISKSGRPLHEWYICVNCRTWYPDPTVAEVPGRDLTPASKHTWHLPCRGVDAAKFSVMSEPVRRENSSPAAMYDRQILIVAEDSLDPAQCLQARRKIKACPVSAASNSPGRGVRRCDLAAAELDLGGQGERKDQDRRRASRSRRTNNAVEHSAGVHPCSIHTRDWAVQPITTDLGVRPARRHDPGEQLAGGRTTTLKFGQKGPQERRTHQSPRRSADGSKRLGVAGAVDLGPVGGVSLMSPAGTQQLPLSAADPNSPSGGGGFIAVFDATTTKVENFTLMVLLRNGSSLSYPAPSAINLRAQDGTRR
jgi:hypothetical protein